MSGSPAHPLERLYHMPLAVLKSLEGMLLDAYNGEVERMIFERDDLKAIEARNMARAYRTLLDGVRTVIADKEARNHE